MEAQQFADRQESTSFGTQMRRATFTRDSLNRAYVAGATSKYVKKQKLEFAIEQLRAISEVHSEPVMSQRAKGKIKQLEQKLSQL